MANVTILQQERKNGSKYCAYKNIHLRITNKSAYSVVAVAIFLPFAVHLYFPVYDDFAFTILSLLYV